jgi:type II restriction/modification system DNA methylase subunit YeeA
MFSLMGKTLVPNMGGEIFPIDSKKLGVLTTEVKTDEHSM